MKKITMVDRVYNYLKEHGSITTWEAIKELGCTRLSEYIRQLKLTHNIVDMWVEDKNRYGENITFKMYMLVEDNVY